jgi:quercetin dioxygenase-like cupin family protein
MPGVVLAVADIEVFDRGSGIKSIPLVGGGIGAKGIATGMTVFPPGGGIVEHSHNVEESVTVLAGSGFAEMEGERTPVSQYDATYIPAGVPHRFVNTGDTEMRILWVYGGIEVTRTVAATGETFAHLSAADRTGTGS